MNERIEAIEAANQILMEARQRAVFTNDIGHTILCHAMDHFNAELKAMVS